MSPQVAAEIKAEIEALKQRDQVAVGPGAACPQCGQTVHRGDAFCSACGASLSLSCPACGQTTVAGDSFCVHCGAALLKEGATP